MEQTEILLNFPVYTGCLDEYASGDDLRGWVEALGCTGVEAIWDYGEPAETLPSGLVKGYHLLFWSDWVDFWRGDESALIRKFGTREEYKAVYGGISQEDMLRQYRHDIGRAAENGARYVVFHVSDVSMQECYTYKWEHSDEEIADAACELINALSDSFTDMTVLVENQWWPGFTFTRPEITERLLSGIRHDDTGIMLDTGHLLNTDVFLTNEKDAAAYIHRMLDRHGSLSRYIYGMHLHKSLSGEYVMGHTGRVPADFPEDYDGQFAYCYPHILKIDRHEPWTCPDIAGVVERISPRYLTHELSAFGRDAKGKAVRTQMEALRQWRK